MKPIKKYLLWLAVSLFVMVGLPGLVLLTVQSDAGMAMLFILWFAINPVYALAVGALAGGDARRLWGLPFIPAGCFVAGAWLLLDFGDPAFFSYAAIYLAIGAAAMGLVALARYLKARM